MIFVFIFINLIPQNTLLNNSYSYNITLNYNKTLNINELFSDINFFIVEDNQLYTNNTLELDRYLKSTSNYKRYTINEFDKFINKTLSNEIYIIEPTIDDIKFINNYLESSSDIDNFIGEDYQLKFNQNLMIWIICFIVILFVEYLLNSRLYLLNILNGDSLSFLSFMMIKSFMICCFILFILNILINLFLIDNFNLNYLVQIVKLFINIIVILIVLFGWCFIQSLNLKSNFLVFMKTRRTTITILHKIFLMILLIVSKLLIINAVIIIATTSIKLSDQFKVLNEWNKVDEYETTVINNFKYLNDPSLNYQNNYDGNLDDVERSNFVQFVEKNYDGSYIIADSGYNSYLPSEKSTIEYNLLVTNTNFHNSFIDRDDLDPNSNYIYISENSQSTKEQITNYVNERYNLKQDLNFITYNTDECVYSYDINNNNEVGENGYYCNPTLLVKSLTEIDDYISSIAFQQIFYKGENVVENYYEQFEIVEKEETLVYNFSKEYKDTLNKIVTKLSITIIFYIILMILLSFVIKFVITMFIESNLNQIILKTTDGQSLLTKYFTFYSLIFILNLIVLFLYLFIILFTEYTLSFFMFCAIFINVLIELFFLSKAILFIESKKIEKIIKGGLL